MTGIFIIPLFSGVNLVHPSNFKEVQNQKNNLPNYQSSLKIDCKVIVKEYDQKSTYIVSLQNANEAFLCFSNPEKITQKAGIRVFPEDKIYLEFEDSQVLPVVVVERTFQIIEKEIPLPFKTVETYSYQLPLGSQKILQKGQNGRKIQKISLRYENGILISQKVIEEKIVSRPQNQVVAFGVQQGIASWYSSISGFRAAHRSLPFGTKVKVTNIINGKSVIVVIADRGPYVEGRIIDLTKEAFAQIASPQKGVVKVLISIVK